MSRHASKNSLMDSNSGIGRPGGEITKQKNIRLSNDPSFGPAKSIRLVTFGCSTLYRSTSSGLSSSSSMRPVISNRLRLLSDLDRLTCAEEVFICRFRFRPDEEDDGGR
jgi:hypothetical protein